MFGERLVVTCLLVAACWQFVLSSHHSNTSTTLSGVEGDGSSSPLGTPPPDSLTPPQPYLMCHPKAIEVTVNEQLHPGKFDYRLVVTHPHTCKGGIIILNTCDGNYEDSFRYQEKGDSCLPKKGSFRLDYIDSNVTSSCFNLSGFELRHEDLVFLNGGEVRVEFQMLPQWAKELKIWVVDMMGNIAGMVTTQDALVIVPGNYTVDQKYFLWHLPMNESMDKKCLPDNALGGIPYVNKKKQEQPVSDWDHMTTLLIVIVLLGVGGMALTTSLCHSRRINMLPCHHNTARTRSASTCSNTSLTVSIAAAGKCSGDVLLVHAGDTPSLTHLCQDLKAAVTKYCGRKVLDITLTDITRLQCPETWLLEVLFQKESAVLLVMSPALAALHRSLQYSKNDSEAVTAVTAKMHRWKELLPVCLQYLQEHLTQNYRRLFVVKFNSEISNEEEDIPDFVPATRFLLPQHRQKLLTALGSCHVYKSVAVSPSAES